MIQFLMYYLNLKSFLYLQQLVEPIDCFGANTGRVRADVTGGNNPPPYTYQWNNGIKYSSK